MQVQMIKVTFIWSGDMTSELAQLYMHIIPNNGHIIEISGKTYRVVSVTWKLSEQTISILVG